MDKEATMEVVEKVVDAVDESVETVERVIPGRRFNLNGTTTGQQAAILLGAVAVGALAGGTVTYFVAKKRLKLKYEAIAQQEVEEAKKFYSALHEKPSPVTLAEQYGEATEAMRSYQGKTEEEPEVLVAVEGTVPAPDLKTVQTENVFDKDMEDSPEDDFDGWDYEAELARRSGNKPYIITHDEYFEGEKDYDQVTFTYYESDDVLTDDADGVISDQDEFVGDDNLTRFGHGSKDNNIVYIRNDQKKMDFEVVRSTGSYTKEVLGFDENELRHDDRRPRKFRHDD